MNAIENGFGYAKRKVKEHDCSTREKAIEAFKKVWSEMGQEYWRNLANSMPRRIEMCVAADGGSIKY